ncbi:MAG: amidohydrolase family protein [Planctomycetota bacterium]
MREVVRGSGPPVDRVVELGDAALTPGLVVAHAHTELTDLGGRVPAGDDFPAWILALLAAREGLDAPASSLRGLRRLAAAGCVAVGDVVGHADVAAAHDASSCPLVVRFHEILDAGNDERGRAAVEEARRAHAHTHDRAMFGVTPHAPYTVSDATLARAGELVREHGLRAQVHFAETPDETRWLRGEGGPFERLLGPSTDRGDSLGRLDRAGLLGPATALVHANDVVAADRARIAASGASVVHCPGTHAFFGRAPFDAQAWLAVGVRPALGTDSLASNDDLDPRRELALAADAFPWIEPRELLAWATEAGARALGLERRVGRIDVDRPFTAAAFRTTSANADDVLEELVRARPQVLGTWVEGREVRGPSRSREEDV